MTKYIDLSGQQLGDYRLSRWLGGGQTSDVYLGQHVENQPEVALKVFNVNLAKEEDRKAFLDEVQALKLEHPHLMPLLDCGIGSDPVSLPFLVMEYAPHGTLRNRHTRGLQLSLEEVLCYIMPLASALQYAHDQRVVHGNIKPGNILFDADDKVLLSDFKLATLIDNTTYLNVLAAKQDAISYSVYTTPEQRTGVTGPASDQFALGVMVYEWLCGKSPFQGALDEGVPPSLRALAPRLSVEVEQVVQRALASDPQKRFASVQEFAAALQLASQDEHTFESVASTGATIITTKDIDPYESMSVTTNQENDASADESISLQDPTQTEDVSQEGRTLIPTELASNTLKLATYPETSIAGHTGKGGKKHYFALASIGLVMLILLGSVLVAGSVVGIQALALPIGLLQNQLATGGASLVSDRQGAPDSTATPTNSLTPASKNNSNTNNHSQATPTSTSTPWPSLTSTSTTQPSPTPTSTTKSASPPAPKPTPTPKPIIAAVDGKNPTTYTVNGQTCDQTLSNSHSRHVTLGGVGATIYFRFSVTCHAAWAKIVFDKALPSGKYGNAKIVRINDGKAFTCDTGGNKYVAPGQTSCYTGMVQDNASETASAYGSYLSSWSSQLGPY
ncbi:protein kinase domain-containing protein [Ktedonobacter robiniae]|uniref:non-specific serine/threonine protein kinase n=1 Tax=Ktedonobacter robiniae TaxID=2778365 RepID=A0ABQ3UWC4_9CHLR|nr:protein kinase [Ktedonobacter robiniae]GHO57139.1 hypothetical protein KSB_56140 [Ktedonobacter robiniae]